MPASSFPGLRFPKGIHGSVQMEQVRKDRRSKDEKESDKVASTVTTTHGSMRWATTAGCLCSASGR